jgi:putative sporulation protein YyaC
MLVIAVDASIGDINHVGYIEVSNRPIKPGSGVGKDLPPVGDIALSGIVTMAGLGALSSIMLQSTSLGLVYKMAEIASKSIIHILYKQQLELKRSKKRIISTAG